MPRLLDLFCGEGGASEGYARAGFEVVGVDIKRMRRYPYEFVRSDALSLSFDFYRSFDVIHASPPCQAYSITKHSHKKEHPELIEPTRELLRAIGRPYVIENVEGAPLIDPMVLCGGQFGLYAWDDKESLALMLKRHRLFECSIPLRAPGSTCACWAWRGHIGGVYGGGSSDRNHALHVRRGGYTPATHVRRGLMGIDWATGYGLTQAIPPAYTHFIGLQIMEALCRSHT